MTPPGPPPDEALLARARRVLNLYRGAENQGEAGGERQAAAGALRRLLVRHNLTLDLLEPGLPPSQEPGDLDGWREAAGLLAQLGTPRQDDALTRLVELEALTPSERREVLARLSLEALAASRAEGWLHAAGDPELTPELLVRAAGTLDPEALAADPAPLAGSVRRLSLEGAWRLARPERRLRVDSEAQAEFLAGIIEGLTSAGGGRRVRVQAPAGGEPGFVHVRLSAGELSRVRALAAQGQAALDRELRAAARRAGRVLGERG